jgi:aspartate racemase
LCCSAKAEDELEKELKMNTVGIIGGIGPESTIEYYRLIISSYLDHEKNGNYPQIIINSINMKKMLDLIGENRLDEVTDYLVAEIQKVAKAGADFALLASNTPHIVFDQINKASPLPLISIVEATCEKVMNIGLKRVGLFGTKFTMQSGFYNEIFSAHDIAVITPEEKEQGYIHEKYMGELVKGIIRDETKSELLKIAHNLKENHGIQGLILGGTELPLILKKTDDHEMPFLDTTRIHVESILKGLY